MGNAGLKNCVPVAGTVRVLRADGKVLDFLPPVLAIQVMKEHPGFLVVRFSLPVTSNNSDATAAVPGVAKAAGTVANKKKICMLRADEELHPGQTYYLIPVPLQMPPKKLSFKSPKSTSRVCSSFEYEMIAAGRVEKKSVTTRKEVQAASPVAQHSHGELLNEGNLMESRVELQHVQDTVDAMECRRNRSSSSRSQRKLPLSQITWKPALASIPECSVELPRLQSVR